MFELLTGVFLGYNDYKFESSIGYGSKGGYLSHKGVQVHNLVKSLIDQGIPIDYVGCQGHINIGYMNDYPGYIESVKQYSKSIASLGVEWHFTEVDVSGVSQTEQMPESEQETQVWLSF